MTQLKDNMSNIEKIRQEIERRLKYTHDWLRGDEKRHPKQTAISKNYYKMKGDERTLDALLSFIDSLPEEKPSEDFPTSNEEMAKFLATHPKIKVPEKYKNPDWLLKKQEQPEMDLKKEVKEWVDLMVGTSFPEQDGDFISEEDYRDVIRQTAYHFYELGLKNHDN